MMLSSAQRCSLKRRITGAPIGCRSAAASLPAESAVPALAAMILAVCKSWRRVMAMLPSGVVHLTAVHIRCRSEAEGSQFQPVFEHAIGSENKCYSNLTSRQLEADPGRPDKRLRPMP